MYNKKWNLSWIKGKRRGRRGVGHATGKKKSLAQPSEEFREVYPAWEWTREKEPLMAVR